MPFLSEEPAGGLPAQIVRQPTPAPVTFGTLVAKAFEDTSIGHLSTSLDYIPPASSWPEPNFDPYAQENISGYEAYANSFTTVGNADEMALMKRKIDDENAHAQLFAENGARGMLAALIAGVADPLNFIPVGGEFAGAYRIGKIGEIANSAYRLGRTGMLSSLAGEGIAQSTSETRTLGQSAEAVAAATVLTGIMGGAAGAFAKDSPLKAIVGDHTPESLAAGAEKELDFYAREAADSAGAMRTPQTTMEQETLSSALGMEKMLKFQDPLMRTSQSPSLETRRVIQDLAEMPLRFKKNEEGVASPIAVESMMKSYQGPLDESFTALDDAFTNYRVGKDKSFGSIAKIGIKDLMTRQDEKLGYLEFRNEVGKALRRGDMHEIPEVAEAAKTFREKVFEPLKKEAIDAGLLPEDVKPETAMSYFSRVYNTEKIIRQRPEFENRLVNWLADEQISASKRLAKLEGKALEGDAAKFADRDRIYSGMSRSDLEDIAQQITDTLVSRSPIRSHYQPIPLTRGPLKERTLGIPDAQIEDFLESDVMHVARRYTRTMSADVELSKRFGRADLEDQLTKIRDDYAKLRQGVTDEKKLAKLDKHMNADIRDLSAVRDRLRGTYALPDNVDGLLNRTFTVARNLNYLRLLGGVTLSSLPDAARIVASHGILRTFRHGIIPLATNLKAVKLAAKEVKLAGTALDMALDSRAMALGEITDTYGRRTRFERGLTAATEHYGVVNLLSPWTAAIKQLYGTVAQTRSLQAIEELAAGTISAKERTRLAQFGIGEAEARKIARQFAKHGEKHGEVWWANTEKWTDREAVTAYRAALVKDVDRAVVTPGQDKPLWMSTPLGKVVGQFRSFALASAQRTMLAGLQERDMAQLNGLMVGVWLGMLSYYLKTPNERLSDNPGIWVKEGLDRSGVTGWMFDANNISEKLTRNTVGVSALLGQPAASRYASRNAVDSLLGPTFGLGKDAADLIGAASSGEWTDADTKRLYRMLPYQNFFALRKLLDAANQ